MGRKAFAYVTTKVYGGKPGDKTVGIHFDARESKAALRLARAILQAIEHGSNIDITIFTYKPLTDGTTRITVTSPS